MTQPLPLSVLNETIRMLEGVRSLTFMDRPDLHTGIAEILSALYDYRVHLMSGGYMEECPPCIDTGVAHAVGMPPHVTAEREHD